MRKLLSLMVAGIFALTLGACGDTATAPDASASVQGGDVVTETADDPLVLPNTEPDFNAEGMVTLRRNPKNNTLSWKLNASGVEGAPGFEKGNAYTVWIEGDPGAGWGSGGVIGGNGEVTASGNHCVWDLVSFWDGGFRPGKKANCDAFDVTEPIAFFVLDHGEWESGDMLERWDPDGNPKTEGNCEQEDACDTQGALGFFFGPLEE